MNEWYSRVNIAVPKTEKQKQYISEKCKNLKKKKKKHWKNKKRWEKTVESRSWVEKDHADSNDPPS